MAKTDRNADHGGLCPHVVALLACPEAKIEHHIEAQLQTSRPDVFYLIRDPPEQFGKMLDGRVIWF
jgi:hypothetical protein